MFSNNTLYPVNTIVDLDLTHMKWNSSRKERKLTHGFLVLQFSPQNVIACGIVLMQISMLKLLKV